MEGDFPVQDQKSDHVSGDTQAEAQNSVGNAILNELTKLTVAQLSNTELKTVALKEVLHDIPLQPHWDLSIQVPRLFKQIHSLSLTPEQVIQIGDALMATYGEAELPALVAQS